MARILLVEPYYSGSHRSWADGIVSHSSHELHLVTHAGGFWKWRMHGAAVTLARSIREVVDDVGPPDVVLVSDMVNVAALIGLARDAVGAAPFVLYLHENQLTYPLRDQAPPDEEYAMANWTSMCASDVVAFNSEHHRRELLTALPPFLRKFPDHRHSALLDDVAARSMVLPVGIDPSVFELERVRDGGPPIVLWNHRWEYDKGPAEFFAAVRELADDGVVFRLAIAGESFQTVPAEFAAARERFSDRIIHFGMASASDYRELLRRADVVVSTARHEFFGLAVAEAMAAGALPVLPRRLAYPELVPEELGGRWLYPDGGAPTSVLRTALTDAASREADATNIRTHLERLSWPNVIKTYDRMLADAADRPRAVGPHQNRLGIAVRRRTSVPS